MLQTIETALSICKEVRFLNLCQCHIQFTVVIEFNFEVAFCGWQVNDSSFQDQCRQQFSGVVGSLPASHPLVQRLLSEWQTQIGSPEVSVRLQAITALGLLAQVIDQRHHSYLSLLLDTHVICYPFFLPEHLVCCQSACSLSTTG